MTENSLTETMSPQYVAGYKHGKGKGAWVIDGNTSAEAARSIIEKYDAGDPEIYEMEPACLSGEWAGESIPELASEYGISLDDDDDQTEFELGFSQGFWDEVIRSAKAIL